MNKYLYTLLCICGGILLPGLAKAQPTANFTSNIITGCSPILVQFTDQSTGNPTSWNWDLGNGTISTLQNPSTTYITPGNYTVTLTVSNGSGSNTKTVVNYINVIPTPIVGFVASDSGSSCPPKTIQFTNQSIPGTAGTTTYFWDFGDGTTSTQANPVHTYTGNGNYSVTLNVTNSTGCSKLLSKVNYIQMISKPTAGFTANNNNSCTAPLPVTFNNTSSGATSYQWNFGDGGTSTAASPSHTYINSGSYTVTLIVSNASGCTDTIVQPAFVNIGGLTASFTKSTTTTCTNNTVTFTNTSVPGAGNSTWYFGDGTSSVGANATHAYAAAGTYNVKLVVSYNNCADSMTQTIVVNQGPSSGFSANNTIGCSVPFTTTFTNTTVGATGYLWVFGDGTTSTAANPTHTYTSLGNYNVALISYGANGCNDTQVLANYISVVNGQIVLSPTYDRGCVPYTTTFTTTLNPVAAVSSYTWNFGDGTVVTGGASMSHTYTTQGNFTVSVTGVTTTGCTYSSNTALIQTGTPPVAGFTATPMTVCPNQVVTFTNTSGPGSPSNYYNHWYFGDGGTSSLENPTYIYSAQGNYTVTLVMDNNGCMDTFTQQITVYPPMAQIAASYSCINKLEASFINSSTGGNIFAWDFGDGTTSNLQFPPPHTYPAYGTYSVTLTVTNLPSGCVSTHTIPVVLYDVDAQFVADDTAVCKNQSVNFTALNSSYITDYIWDFGDGNSQTVPSSTISHSYTASGIYTVTLIVRDVRGCYDTVSKLNYISVGGPTASFVGVPTSGCAPLTVAFTDQSTSVTGISNRLWTFGDGTTGGNLANISHTYLVGTYPVMLTVTDGNGCSDAQLRLSYINATKPTASFTAQNPGVCPGQPVIFNDASVGANLTYQWTFGDGGTSTVANPTHSYSQTGLYDVMLIVTDATGCKDTLNRIAYINVGGINLGFTASDTFATCPPLTVTFTNTSTLATSYMWKFGNGNTSSITSPSTIFSLPGVYTVKLIGQNGGCVDSVTKNITVLGPTGTFTYSPINGCVPLTVQFSATTQNTQQLIWDMNNGVTQTTTASSTTYTYTAPGKYVPKVLLSDGVSCVVPIQGPDTIKVDQVVGDFTFGPNNICNSGTIQFSDTVLFNVNPVTTRSWTFGDGGTSTAHNPAHLYNSAGTYTVTLIIGSNQGCTDTVIKTVTILPPPNVSAGGNIAICPGSVASVQLQATGASTYVWSPSGTLSCTNCANPTASPTATTTYTVIGTNANGCSDTAQVTVSLNAMPTVQTGTNPSICAGSNVQLAVTGATNYTWSPSTGLSCTNCSNPIAAPSATTTYTVIGSNGAGCSDTAQVTVTVNGVPAVTATAANNTMCAGGSTQLQATGAATYTWTPAAGLSCTTCANPTATPSSTTTYVVTGINAAGCADTGMVTITINQQPPVSGGNNQSICLGTSVQLQASGATSYSWSPSIGLSCTNCANPVANPTTTSTYTIIGTDAVGCVDTSQVTVTVNNLPTVSAGNNQSACAGTAVSLQATGASSYTWSPSAGLSCVNCANPSAAPGSTTSYTVIGADANGCKDTAQVTVTVNPLPNVSAGPDVSVCNLNSTQLQASGATSYSWMPAGSLSCSTCPNPVASPGTATTYTVTGTDGNGCTNTATVNVSIYPQPQINAGLDQTVCRGQSVQLQATGGQTYVWSPSTWLSCTNCAAPTSTPSNNITYTVVGTDAHGCSDSDKVNIEVIQMQPFVIGAGDTLCEGETTQLNVSGGEQYTWYPPSGLSSTTVANPIASPGSTTTYTVVIRQGSCFSDTAKITVVVHPKPTVNAGPDQKILAGTSVNIFANATHTDSYLWTPATDLSCETCMNPVATPKQTTTYKVTAANDYGCKADDDITIFITCDNSQVFVANTFTPNGDGNNDLFYPQGKGLSIIHHFRVYSRWGELLYDAQNIQPNDAMFGWDGTYKGEQLKPDVYVWLLDADCSNGTPIQLKGDISLVR